MYRIPVAFNNCPPFLGRAFGRIFPLSASTAESLEVKTIDVNPDTVGSAYNFGRSGAGSVSTSTKCRAKLYFFPENLNILSKISENYNTFDADEKNETM